MYKGVKEILVIGGNSLLTMTYYPPTEGLVKVNMTEGGFTEIKDVLDKNGVSHTLLVPTPFMVDLVAENGKLITDEKD